MRDSQKNKVYNAEFPVRRNVEHVKNHEEVQAFVDRILQNKRVIAKYGKQLTGKTLFVEVRRGHRYATGGFNGIKIPDEDWARNKLVIVHEIAHVIVCRTFYGRPIASHGREFCEVFLDLTRFVLGSVTHAELLESYKKCGVKYKPKAKRTLTPEQRAALVERAAHARQVRMNSLRG